TRKLSTLSGTVTGATQLPMSNVRVRAQDSQGRIATDVTDEVGRYRIELPPGTYQLSGELEEFFLPPMRAIGAVVDVDAPEVEGNLTVPAPEARIHLELPPSCGSVESELLMLRLQA